MFRLFDMLGRSSAMRALDDALRAWGVHPLLVPEAVKLTVIQLCKKFADPHGQADFGSAAQMLAYCILGHAQFTQSHGAEDAAHLDLRVDTALDNGDTLDAKLILLALHAGLMSPDVADRIDLEDT